MGVIMVRSETTVAGLLGVNRVGEPPGSKKGNYYLPYNHDVGFCDLWRKEIMIH